MNKTKIKNYAPKARQEFIQAVKDRAAFYGMKEVEGEVVIEPAVAKGDSVLVGGRAFPPAVVEKRKKLEEQVRQHGFPQTMEKLAYTWFNRLIAIRFMELHGYLDHGYRVLSHPEGKPMPEILDHAEHVDLPGLDQQRVIDLKIDGTKETELYRLLLVAQCNALHDAMPFLFERIDDETELVLPDSLLHSDSLIRNLVNEIDEADWLEEVEVIGWVYEAYISGRYEAVIGKVIASEDIPAATQKFTPKWVVRYLVQNTLGRLWLATYPQSPLRQQMKYYIEPAEQTPEVQELLKAITPTSVNPEEITFLDPACGSAHILVEAYDLFKAIYQERGYRAKDIPSLILRKNLFGLEIDDRAAQLAGFALLMKARADDRHIFAASVQPNVLSIQAREGADSEAYVDAEDITNYLNDPVLTQELPPSGKLWDDEDGLFTEASMAMGGDLALTDISALVDLFRLAKTVGSMIRLPATLAKKLPQIEERARLVAKHGRGFSRIIATDFLPFVVQAKLLARQYDCVAANPPYMGSKYYNPTLKAFASSEYKDAKADLYACFIQRNCDFTLPNGFVGMITIPNWMFLSSFEEMRKPVFVNQTIDTFIHNGRGVFGSDFGSCSFVLRNQALASYYGKFRRLFTDQVSVATNDELEQRFFAAQDISISSEQFARLPGQPIAYWLSKPLAALFARCSPLESVADARPGLQTSDNDRFLRYWFEVDFHRIGFGHSSRADAAQSGKKWFPCNKGGPFRRWYGNFIHVVNWENDGKEIYEFARSLYGSPTRIVKNANYYFRPGLTWSDVTIGESSFRVLPQGFIFDATGHSAFFAEPIPALCCLGLVNTKVIAELVKALNPSVHFHVGYFRSLPYPETIPERTVTVVEEAISVARLDWDSFETSWDFHTLTALQQVATTLQDSQEAADAEYFSRFRRLKELEEENNCLFIEAYSLQGELFPDVPDDQIALYRPDRAEDIKRLLSYALGCMMGRYSLDKPGLVYAHGGSDGFDPSQYTTFPADQDGILPITELDWGFQDDTAHRVEEFMAVAWPKEHLAENLTFIADSIGPAKGEQPRDTIRRYLAAGFYKDHLRWYKRRPIYWLFSSGKQRAFQCLVYLHRHHEGTLARMRTEYVIPLQGRIAARIEQLEGDKTKATSTSRRRKLQKEQDDLKKRQTELLAFEEKLKHAADMRIKLDLDDGVKVNYGKFGDLLAEVKAVTGGKDED